jgi:Spy/CpxP family protein refolding chaperone
MLLQTRLRRSRMKKMVTVIAGSVLLISLSLISAPLFAQEDFPPDRRERVLERIEMMRMWKMTEDLELTEREGSILFPFLRELEQERKEFDRERRIVLHELRATVRGENPDHGVINELLEKLARIREELRRLDNREYEKVREVLNPEQVARRSRQDEPRRNIPERREPVHEEGHPPPEDLPH